MTKALFLCNISLVPSESLANADVAQSVERRLGKAEVTGSIPVISFTKNGLHACMKVLFFVEMMTGQRISEDEIT